MSISASFHHSLDNTKNSAIHIDPTQGLSFNIVCGGRYNHFYNASSSRHEKLADIHFEIKQSADVIVFINSITNDIKQKLI